MDFRKVLRLFMGMGNLEVVLNAFLHNGLVTSMWELGIRPWWFKNNVPHMLRHFSIFFQLEMLLEVMDPLGAITLLEEVCHLAWALHIYSHITFTLLFLLLECVWNNALSVLSLAAYFYVSLTFLDSASGAVSQNKLFIHELSLGILPFHSNRM